MRQKCLTSRFRPWCIVDRRLRKDQLPAPAGAGVRVQQVLVLVLALLVTGCVGSDSGEPGDGSDGGSDTGGSSGDGGSPGGTAPRPECMDEIPAIVEVFNDTIEVGSPGGSGETVFDVPDCYLELFITDVGDVTALGDVVLKLRAPSGAEESLLDGVYFQQDEVGQPSDALACSPCEWRITSEPGSWLLSWEVQGELRLPLKAQAQ